MEGKLNEPAGIAVDTSSYVYMCVTVVTIEQLYTEEKLMSRGQIIIYFIALDLHVYIHISMFIIQINVNDI